MRAVVQRVSRAEVRVDGATVSTIGAGVLVLVGVAVDDEDQDAVWIADKIRTLRIFPDENGIMNRSLEEAGGEALVVSQFTLQGDARRGRRPSYIRAAEPERAVELYAAVLDALRAAGVSAHEGRFQADMAVELVNDGPVTILLDSKKTF